MTMKDSRLLIDLVHNYPYKITELAVSNSGLTTPYSSTFYVVPQTLLKVLWNATIIFE